MKPRILSIKHCLWMAFNGILNVCVATFPIHQIYCLKLLLKCVW